MCLLKKQLIEIISKKSISNKSKNVSSNFNRCAVTRKRQQIYQFLRKNSFNLI